MGLLDSIILNLPEVAAPKQKKLSFNKKLMWTFIVLVLFFILGLIPLWGLGDNSLQQFQYLSLILGAEFGSLISLGIGPIVTGSIILQLLNGAGIFKFDLNTHEGKQKYQGIQKLTSLFFIVFEAFIYVFMGGLTTGYYFDPAQNQFLINQVSGAILLSPAVIFNLKLFLVFQLFLGGVIILLMDEVVSKWGFGSGISLFIAAGISKQIFVRLLSFTDTSGALFWEHGFQGPVVGTLWTMLNAFVNGDVAGAAIALVTILSTIVVFVIAVYAQAMKVEIPLSFGRVRGQGIRWPLQFVYTSNMPVILVASMFATLQLWMRLLQGWLKSDGPVCWLFSNTPYCFPGGFSGGSAVGFISALNGPNMVDILIQHWGEASIIIPNVVFTLVYILLMVGGSVLFSVFWVQTSGMDASSLADQILSSGLQIPGFRKDRRIMEKILSRYIMPLTVMGGFTVGFLAATADLLGALSRGTGILLTVMIVYQLYESIAREHMYDMNPMLKKFMGK